MQEDSVASVLLAETRQDKAFHTGRKRQISGDFKLEANREHSRLRWLDGLPALPQ